MLNAMFLIWGNTPHDSQFCSCSEFILGFGANSQVAVGSDTRGRWLSGVGSDNNQAGMTGSLLILLSCFLSPTYPVTAGSGRKAGEMNFSIPRIRRRERVEH